MKIRFSIYLIFFLLTFVPANAKNDIKLGTAKLTVTLDAPTNIPIDSVEAWADVSELFFGSYEDKRVDLIRKDNTFYGDIPLELKEEIIGVEMAYKDRRFGFPVPVYQDYPIMVTIKIDSTFFPDIESARLNDPYGMSFKDWLTTSEMYVRFLMGQQSSPYYDVPADKYGSWSDVREYELNKMLPYQINYALDGKEIPAPVHDLLINNMKIRFASIQVIPYVPAADRRGITVEAPPMEAYTFLDSIDYNPDVFLRHMPQAGLKPFLYTLLRFPGGGFERIGEMPVKDWKDMAREKLRPAMAEPSDLLLDLLSAMCYVEQVDILNKPLTKKQKENITAGYTNDLGKIILNKDSMLTRRLEAAKQLVDLSDKEFDLKSYIDDKFPGMPVVVDLWNTWCMPCLVAIGRADAVRKNMDTQDAVFLYISDVSSDKAEWERMVLDIHGINVRINAESVQKLMESNGLTGFPSYIFFDRNHKAVYAGTTYPGSDKYENLIKTILAR